MPQKGIVIHIPTNVDSLFVEEMSVDVCWYLLDVYCLRDSATFNIDFRGSFAYVLCHDLWYSASLVRWGPLGFQQWDMGFVDSAELHTATPFLDCKLHHCPNNACSFETRPVKRCLGRNWHVVLRVFANDTVESMVSGAFLRWEEAVTACST